MLRPYEWSKFRLRPFHLHFFLLSIHHHDQGSKPMAAIVTVPDRVGWASSSRREGTVISDLGVGTENTLCFLLYHCFLAQIEVLDFSSSDILSLWLSSHSPQSCSRGNACLWHRETFWPRSCQNFLMLQMKKMISDAKDQRLVLCLYSSDGAWKFLWFWSLPSCNEEGICQSYES